jgi:hypothetical protein
MNARNTERLMELVKPILRQGEQIEQMTAARVGSVSAKRQVATTAIVAIATAGIVRVTVHAAPRYLVLTSQRLLIINMLRTGRPVGPLLAQMPRQAVATTRLRSRLAVSFTIQVNGDPKPLKLAWGQPGRKDARALQAALAPRPLRPPDPSAASFRAVHSPSNGPASASAIVSR